MSQIDLAEESGVLLVRNLHNKWAINEWQEISLLKVM